MTRIYLKTGESLAPINLDSETVLKLVLHCSSRILASDVHKWAANPKPGNIFVLNSKFKLFALDLDCPDNEGQYKLTVK